MFSCLKNHRGQRPFSSHKTLSSYCLPERKRKKCKKNPGEELNNRYYITPNSQDASCLLLRTTGDVEGHRVLLVVGALEIDAETIDVLGTDKVVVDGPRVLSEAVVDG